MITNIEDIKDILADEAQFPTAKGFRRVDSPAFIFFDDDRELDPEVRKFRDDLLDYEEWNAARSTFDEEAVPPATEAFFDRMESRASARWLISWHKRQMERGNDLWHKLKKDIGIALSERAEAPSSLLHGKIAGAQYKALMAAMKERMKYAPGPVAGTVFVNPDGSRFPTNGLNPVSAKASYVKRHKLSEEFVSVDRVQKEGSKVSHWVVGTRRTSDVTISNYYDPSPAYTERKLNGEWVRAYDPGERNLYMVTPSTVMPFGSHRLTIREFERAIIAGAATMDDEEEGYADAMSRDVVVDVRQRSINMGYGSETRDESVLTHQEAYLYGIFRLFEQDQACELMLLEKQEPGALATHFMKNGDYEGILEKLTKDKRYMELMDELLESATREEVLDEIISKVAQDDQPTINRRTGELVPPVNEEPLLPWVFELLTGVKPDA